MTASRSKNSFSVATLRTLFPLAVFATAIMALPNSAAITRDVATPTSRANSPEVVFQTAVKNGPAALAYSLPIGLLPPVTALAFSPDGSKLAVAGYRAVFLWDAKAGKLLATIPNLAGQVQSVAFHPKDSYLAVAGGEPGRAAQALVYDLRDLSRKTFLLGHSDVVSHIVWSADGTRLATAGHDKTARIWTWPGGLVKTVLRGQSDSATRVSFSPDVNSIYTASLDRNIRRFDSTTGQLTKTYSGSGDSISALAISPDGRQIVSSGAEVRIRWWNPDAENTVRFSDGSGGEVSDLVFSKDGKVLASVSADRKLRLWRVDNGYHLREMAGSNDWLFAVALSPDGKLAAGAGTDGVVRLWEVETCRLRAGIAAALTSASSEPDWVAIIPEGYFAASPRWLSGIVPMSAEKLVTDPHVVKFVRSLLRPEQVAIAMTTADVKVAEIPVPSKPAAPAKGGGK